MAENKRMEWLDAMRGFTMILVVAYHVAQFGFVQSEKISASLPFLVLFRMPLFFFVSGFLAYKSKFIWTASSFFSLTWKKMKIQVLPALVFLCLFIIFRKHGDFFDVFLACLKLPTKSGYWFTWVLLQMFIVYYVVAAFSQKIDSHLPIIVLWLIALGIYASLYMPVEFGKYWKTPFLMYSSIYETMKFFHFFLLGNIFHRYWGKAQNMFDTQWFFPLLVCIAIFSCADIFHWHLLTGELTNLPRTAAMYSLMLMVIMFFRYYKDSFTNDKILGMGLQYIGTRTLDIYLLHFILLPKIPQVGAYLDANSPNFVLDIALAVPVALVVILFCCITSNILRVSPVLKKYLFGR
ncbi:MAG: acyltransferase family protein [Bacteroidaceae bacterium]|nr:acyltransferase family protein [Bacteroidaceae bacterium]